MPVAVPVAMVVGAGIQAYMQHKATQAQSQSTGAALDFEKQQAAQRKTEFDSAMQDYQAKWSAWNNNRNALLQRYGIDIGSTPGGGGSVSGLAGGAPAAPRTAPVPTQGQINIPTPAGAQMANTPQTVSGLMAAQPALGSWNNWRAQGLQA